MTTQPTLSDFAQKTISFGKAMRDFRAWNRVILDWDIAYQGYQRDEQREGHVDFHVQVVIREASVRLKDSQTQKMRKMPGYSLAIFQVIALGGDQSESLTVYEESFRINELPKAFDAFQQSVLTVQTWAEIAESRARVMPNQNDVFECFHCGWATDIWSDEITCEGCGKRYWSERMWSKRLRDGDSPRPVFSAKHGA
jgi:hypothetical protein